MNLDMFCESLGIDRAKTMERFAGNEQLYVKFLKKFGSDPAFSQITSAAESEPADLDVLAKSAHTLKGVALNLGLDRLGGACQALVAAAREKRTDEIPELYDACSREYRAVLAALELLG